MLEIVKMSSKLSFQLRRMLCILILRLGALRRDTTRVYVIMEGTGLRLPMIVPSAGNRVSR